ncbi:MAG: LamG domain-containing protein [Bdellovibrionales bacterium]|nr:LamG domain-containing protein [Bdellovibrionales bacterium]
MIIKGKVLLSITRILNLSIFLFIALFFSCSRQQKTTLVITKGASVEVSQDGGIMIWGYHRDSGENMAISIQGNYTSKEVDLKVGDWEFFAIGWTGSNSLEGDNRCAIESMYLHGAKQNLSLTLNKSTCSNGDFSNSENIGTDNQFKKLKLFDCVSAAGLNSISSDEGISCSNINSGAGSFRLIFYEVYNSEISGYGIKSDCQSFNKSVASTDLLIPTGNSTTNKFYTSIEVYSDESCSDDLQLFTYLNGIGQSESYDVDSSKFFASSNATILTTNLFILYTKAIPAEEEIEVEAYSNNYALMFDTSFSEIENVLKYSPLIIGTEEGSPGVSGINDITISLWAKVKSSEVNGVIIEQSNNEIDITVGNMAPLEMSFEVFINGGALCFVFNESSENHCVDIDENNFLDDDWHNLVFIREYIDGDTKVYIYIDNVGSSSVSTAQAPTDVSLLPVIIGPEFRGLIDELAIWNTALDADQVESIYNNGVTLDLSEDNETYTSSGNLTGFWNFNQTIDFFNKNGGSVSFEDITGNTDYNAISTSLIDDIIAYSPQKKDDIPNNSKYINISSMYFETDSVNDYTDFSFLDTSSTSYSLNSSKSEGFTISAWIKTSSDESCQTIIAQAQYDRTTSNNENYYILAVRNGYVTWELAGDVVTGNADNYAFTTKNDFENDNLLVSTATVNDGDWHHIVVVRPSVSTGIYYFNQMYIDGAINNDEKENDSVNVTLDDRLFVSIGGHSGHYNNSSNYSSTCLFQGYIDEVSIWDKQLSADEITSLYNNGQPIDIKNNKGDYISSENIKAYWPFDEKSVPLLEYNTYYGDNDLIGGPDEEIYTILPSASPINYPLTPPYAESNAE